MTNLVYTATNVKADICRTYIIINVLEISSKIFTICLQKNTFYYTAASSLFISGSLTNRHLFRTRYSKC